jgi:hypothetical protein
MGFPNASPLGSIVKPQAIHGGPDSGKKMMPTEMVAYGGAPTGGRGMINQPPASLVPANN